MPSDWSRGYKAFGQPSTFVDGTFFSIVSPQGDTRL